MTREHHNMKSTLLVFGSAILLAAVTAPADGKIVKNGDTIVLVGDSITQYGAKSDTGYVQLFVRGLKTTGVDFKWIGAGIAGNKSIDMRNRFDTDVLAKNPTIVTINAGVNDANCFSGEGDYAKFAENIADMATRAQAAGAKVLLLTPTTSRGEKPNKEVAKMADIMRAYAASNSIVLADTQKAVRAVIDDPEAPLLQPSGLKATADGVHMAETGDREMARCLLAAFGLSKEDLQKVEEDWNSAAICSAGGSVPVSLATYDLMEKIADAKKLEIGDAGGNAMRAGIEKFLADPTLSAKPVPTEKPSSEMAKGCEGGNIVACGGFLFWLETVNNPSGLPRLIKEAFAANGSPRRVWTGGPGERATLKQVDEKFDAILKDKNASHLLVVVEPEKDAAEQDIASAASIARKAREAGVKAVFLTARPGKGDEVAVNEAILKLADPPAVCVLDANAIMKDELARRAANPKASFRVGLCNLNPRVNFLMANGLLPMLGFDPATAERAKRHWLAMPSFGGAPASHKFGFETFDKLLAAAKANHVPLSEVFAECLSLGAEAQ